MLEWLIIGGGIHGTYLSNLLVHAAGVRPDDIRVLDPHLRPLALWDRHAEACGMKYLRSPSTHNIDLPVLSLYRFAQSVPEAAGRHFIPLYNRPSVSLFRRHCRRTIEMRGLDKLRVLGRANDMHRGPGGLIVESDAGRIKAQRVLLALGLTEQPRWPAWAKNLQERGGRVDHLFSRDVQRAGRGQEETVVVVGGGISAVQAALRLAKDGAGSVVLLSRHRLREVPFDFNPCWIGPKCMRGFVRLPIGERRPVIDAARQPGTAPAEVMAEMQEALSAAAGLCFVRGRVCGASVSGDVVRLQTDEGRNLEASRVVLATGFDPRRPGGRFIDRAVAALDLPVSGCGYPVAGDDLQWGRSVFVTGPLAELRIGPCARNIAGARNAGRLLLSFLKKKKST